MGDRSTLSRRDLLGAGIVLPLGVLATPATSSGGTCGATPRQTSGPFYPLYDQVDKDIDLTQLVGHDDPARGLVIRVQGQVRDTGCRPVAGALVDLWQADSNGRYSHPGDPNPARRDPDFQGWGQAVTDADGRYAFTTIKPAAYPLEFLDGRPDERAGYRTPHIHFRVSKRGYRELSTQMYFAGEALNDADIVLRGVAEAERAKVVISPTVTAPKGSPVFRFDMTIAVA